MPPDDHLPDHRLRDHQHPGTLIGMARNMHTPDAEQLWTWEDQVDPFSSKATGMVEFTARQSGGWTGRHSRSDSETENRGQLITDFVGVNLTWGPCLPAYDLTRACNTAAGVRPGSIITFAPPMNEIRALPPAVGTVRSLLFCRNVLA